MLVFLKEDLILPLHLLWQYTCTRGEFSLNGKLEVGIIQKAQKQGRDGNM